MSPKRRNEFQVVEFTIRVGLCRVSLWVYYKLEKFIDPLGTGSVQLCILIGNMFGRFKGSRPASLLIDPLHTV